MCDRFTGSITARVHVEGVEAKTEKEVDLTVEDPEITREKAADPRAEAR